MKFNSVSKNCIDLIKTFEGFKPKLYFCPAGLPTIGYGTVIDSKEEEWLKSTTITEEQAIKLVHNDLKETVRMVNIFVISNINQNQFDALCDFAYNCGIGNLQKSTLLKLVNKNPNDPKIKDEFLKWSRANGKILKGLENRRLAESTLYFK